MAVIASQSFENETAQTGADGYITPETTLGSTVELSNQAGGVVESTGADPTGIAYTATLTGTRAAVQASDADTLGVATAGAQGEFTDWADGNAGYVFGDPDGLLELTFEEVDVSNYENVTVSFSVFVSDTGYEANDSFQVTLLTDSGEELLVDFGESELEAASEEFQTISFDLPAGATFAQLVVSSDTNASGETIFFDNLVIEGDLICFVSGTRIETAAGVRAVEDLQPGDEVRTLRGFKPLLWVGCSTILPREAQQPVLFRKGSWLGNTHDLRVSPAHRMLVQGWQAQALFGTDEVLVAARDLVNEETIVGAPVAAVTYWHLMFEDHELLRAEGCWSESLQLGETALDSMSEATRAEVRAVALDMDMPVVRPALTSAEARALR